MSRINLISPSYCDERIWRPQMRKGVAMLKAYKVQQCIESTKRLTTSQIANSRNREVFIKPFDTTLLARLCDTREIVTQIKWWVRCPGHWICRNRNGFGGIY